VPAGGLFGRAREGAQDYPGGDEQDGGEHHGRHLQLLAMSEMHSLGQSVTCFHSMWFTSIGLLL